MDIKFWVKVVGIIGVLAAVGVEAAGQVSCVKGSYIQTCSSTYACYCNAVNQSPISAEVKCNKDGSPPSVVPLGASFTLVVDNWGRIGIWGECVNSGSNVGPTIPPTVQSIRMTCCM
ncbi:hypothetical protein THII_3854 [Thioploca ingrica]|uniref:Uncharacterized protein n=1 Tax=Thioploca ingrica TaxID=40754 RepID=A0A090BW82_9GAMM|nr:hypothetical protein THII_3854 [Thioploca ingrica]